MTDMDESGVPLWPARYHLARVGRVLGTRGAGGTIGQEVADAVAASRALLLNFHGVDVASPPFLDEALTAILGVLRAHDRFLFVTGCNEDVRESLVMVLERRKAVLAEITDEHVALLGGNAQLQVTLDEAAKMQAFTSPELAEHLRLKLPALHQRLNALRAAGAIVRERDPQPERGVRFIYRVAPKEVTHA